MNINIYIYISEYQYISELRIIRMPRETFINARWMNSNKSPKTRPIDIFCGNTGSAWNRTWVHPAGLTKSRQMPQDLSFGKSWFGIQTHNSKKSKTSRNTFSLMQIRRKNRILNFYRPHMRGRRRAIIRRLFRYEEIYS